jgi:hypothetical protein
MTSFTSSPDNWTSLYAPDKDEFILQDMEVFDSFLALYGTTPTLSPAVIIKPTHDTDYNQLIVRYHYQLYVQVYTIRMYRPLMAIHMYINSQLNTNHRQLRSHYHLLFLLQLNV